MEIGNSEIQIKHEKIKLTLLMVIVYLIYLISAVNSLPLANTAEEVGALSGAAYLGGLDWSGTIANSGYYGLGWYSQFFWIFKLTDSPFIIYSLVLAITGLIKPIILLIAYYLIKKFFYVKSEMYLFVLSFLAPFLGSGIGIVTNEPALELCIWAVLLVLCKFVQYREEKKGAIYLVFTVLICIYALFLHTRALTLLIALAIVLFGIFAFLKDKRALFSVPILLILGLLSEQIIGYLQTVIWNIDSSGSLANSSVSVSSNIEILNPKTWSIWFHMLLGMVTTENICTFGLFVLGIIGFIFIIFFLKKRRSWIENKYFIITISLTVLCMGAVICAFLVSGWFSQMFVSWDIEAAQTQYEYKGLMYVRYWNVFLSPFLICVLSYLPKLNYKKILSLSLISTEIVNILFIFFVLPYVQDNNSAAVFLYGIGYKHGTVISEEYYLRCLLISFIVFLIAMFLILFSRRRLLFLTPIILGLIIFTTSRQLEYYQPLKDSMADKITSSYYEKCKLQEEGIEIGTIYLNDESDAASENLNIYSIAQFYFNRYNLQIGIPDDIGDNDIIISTTKSDIIEKKFTDLPYIVLDNNEVWYSYLPLSF